MKSQEELPEDTTPRVYVASLSDYNNGDLLGRWFAFCDYDDAAELLADVQAMLKTYDKLYPLPFGQQREEWAAHDYENFPERLYSESMDFNVVYAWIEAVAEMDDERREAYELFINNGDDANQFEGRYLGRYGEGYHHDDEKVMEDYAETTFWECHSKDEIPKSVVNYIDFKSMGRDIMLSGDVWCDDGFVFRS